MAKIYWNTSKKLLYIQNEGNISYRYDQEHPVQHSHCTLLPFIHLLFTSQMVTKPMSCSSHNDFTDSSSYRHSNNSKLTFSSSWQTSHNALHWGIFDTLCQGTYKKGVNVQHKQHEQTSDSTNFHQNHFQLVTVLQEALGEQSDIPGISNVSVLIHCWFLDHSRKWDTNQNTQHSLCPSSVRVFRSPWKCTRRITTY
jgi:hypothetical protein